MDSYPAEYCDAHGNVATTIESDGTTLRMVILCTGVERELRSSEYNKRRRECEEAVTRLAAVDDDIRALRDVEPEQLHSLLRHLPPPLDRRARHAG